MKEHITIVWSDTTLEKKTMGGILIATESNGIIVQAGDKKLFIPNTSFRFYFSKIQ